MSKEPKRKGEEGEAKVHWLLVQKGFDCAWPVGDSATWDLVSDWRGKVNRLQVKSSYAPNKKTPTSHYIKFARGTGGQDNYRPKDFDFAVAVLPFGVYIIPGLEVIGRKIRTLVFFENGTHSYGHQCEWEKYREAWHLLQ